MRRFRAKSLASRLLVLAVLPSALPLFVICLYDANRPAGEQRLGAERQTFPGAAEENAGLPAVDKIFGRGHLAHPASTSMGDASRYLGLESPATEPAQNALSPGVLALPAGTAQPGSTGADAPRSPDLSLSMPAADLATWSWQAPGASLLALAYLAGLALAACGAWSVSRSLYRFRRLAREVALGRVGGNALAGRNDALELAEVAGIVDGLVSDLQKVAGQMRIATAENVHSLRTPLATINAAFRTVGRFLPADEPKAQRARLVIDASLVRLSGVLDAMERHDAAIAEYLVLPREDVNVGRLLHELVRALADDADGRGIRFTERLQDDVLVCASRHALGSLLSDVLSGAVGVSPALGEVTVTLEGGRGADARIVVEDCGDDAEDVDLLFQHDFTPAGDAAGRAPGACRASLWHVKRVVEALDGGVSAHRNLQGGVSVAITLPTHRIPGGVSGV
jgi:signal transduction histidine kinase